MWILSTILFIFIPLYVYVWYGWDLKIESRILLHYLWWPIWSGDRCEVRRIFYYPLNMCFEWFLYKYVCYKSLDKILNNVLVGISIISTSTLQKWKITNINTKQNIIQNVFIIGTYISNWIILLIKISCTLYLFIRRTLEKLSTHNFF